jgi:uncharacterized radical SAM superfamily Fe-S cluster-containing enzyme
MCRACRAIVPARILEQGGAVYQERLCPTCGPARARIADSLAWYLDRLRTVVSDARPLHPGPVRRGCPLDCGPCAFHAVRAHLPVISVTNACNLRCPICFTYNRREPPYFMDGEELGQILDAVAEHAGPVDLINVTGGEPTLHPRILPLLEQCRREGIGRVTMNSNGLRLAAEPDFCRELAARDAYCILSLHSLRPEVSLRLHRRDITREKRAALENLGRAGVGTTLLMVLARGVNEADAGDILRLAKGHPHVRSLTIQTMTYTGQGGRSFAPREHLPLDGAAAILQDASEGEIQAGHFIAHPRVHPLCYSVAYYLRTPAGLRSFTEFLTPEELAQLLGAGYLVSADGDAPAILKTGLDRIWSARPDSPLLPQFRRMLDRLYPAGASRSRFQRQRICEEEVLTVYLHAHMDEDSLDLARLVACADQVPDRHGRLVPACAYNLFHRMQDARFFDPAATGDPPSAVSSQGEGDPRGAAPAA